MVRYLRASQTLHAERGKNDLHAWHGTNCTWNHWHALMFKHVVQRQRLDENDFMEIAKIIVLEVVKVMNEIIRLCQNPRSGKLRREFTELLGRLLCVREQLLDGHHQ